MTLKGKTVLVVEDTYDDMQLVSTILKHNGVTVIRATNGQECLDLVKTASPAVIVTDLSMPEIDGWELLKQLRADPQTEAIPVVAMTAYYSIDVKQDAVDAGFNGYFAKPISARFFVKSLEHIIDPGDDTDS